MQDTQREIRELIEEAERELLRVSAAEEIAMISARYLGRKGKLREIRQRLPGLPEEDRADIGRSCNEAQRRMEEIRDRRLSALEAERDAAAADTDTLDVTLPGRAPRIGRAHPLLTTLEDMISVFLGLGFTVAEGPEVESHYYSWEALNYPPDHPAMDEQMTFYIGDDVMLRSQTSTVQIRHMEAHEPPVRVVAPGRCFRRDTVDATHCHTFYQLEGLLVDEGVTMADLRGTLEAFAHGMYGDRCHVRFRPDFFPFTEPSAEFALSCTMCEGAGCRVCSRTGWLEVGGCGMVDPNVLQNIGYDAERYTGYAFGVGVERFAMLRYGIDDIRLFYSGDMRFLGQF